MTHRRCWRYWTDPAQMIRLLSLLDRAFVSANDVRRIMGTDIERTIDDAIESSYVREHRGILGLTSLGLEHLEQLAAAPEARSLSGTSFWPRIRGLSPW